MQSEPQNVDGARQPLPGIVIAAFISACLGFVCGFPAIVGLVLGIVGLGKAQSATRGKGLAIAAIAISAGWLLLGAVLLGVALAGSGKGVDTNKTAPQSTPAAVPPPSATASAEPGPSEPPAASDSSEPLSSPSSPPETATPALDMEVTYVKLLREAPGDLAKTVQSFSDARLLRDGRAICRLATKYGQAGGFGLAMARQNLKAPQVSAMMSIAYATLCPELGDSLEAFVDTLDDGTWMSTAATSEPFASMISQARTRSETDLTALGDTDLVKMSLVFCSVLNSKDPAAGFRKVDESTSSTDTPALILFYDLVVATHQNVCPAAKATPLEVAEEYVDRYVG